MPGWRAGSHSAVTASRISLRGSFRPRTSSSCGVPSIETLTGPARPTCCTVAVGRRLRRLSRRRPRLRARRNCRLPAHALRGIRHEIGSRARAGRALDPNRQPREIESTRHPLVAGVASGLLLWTSFPPLEWHAMAWVALAPLFWVVTVREARFKAYLAAWLGGLCFWLLALQWLNLLDVGRMRPAGSSCRWSSRLVVAAVPGVARLAVFRLRIPLMMAAPIIWVGLEFGRGVLPLRLSVVLPGPQPVPKPLFDPDRRLRRARWGSAC